MWEYSAEEIANMTEREQWLLTRKLREFKSAARAAQKMRHRERVATGCTGIFEAVLIPDAMSRKVETVQIDGRGADQPNVVVGLFGLLKAKALQEELTDEERGTVMFSDEKRNSGRTRLNKEHRYVPIGRLNKRASAICGRDIRGPVAIVKLADT